MRAVGAAGPAPPALPCPGPGPVRRSTLDPVTDDPRPFHKPVRRPAELFDRLFSAEDPAEVSRVAHSTAQALLSRVRENPDVAVVDRLVAFTTDHGIDDIAELWSRAPAKSLPGALWRLYLLQLMIHDDPQTAALLYERGRTATRSSDEVVVGAPAPASPAEMVALIDMILRGLFEGDFALALERASAFCRIQSAGATHIADDYEATEPERASALTTRALRLARYAEDLGVAAGLWRRESLTEQGFSVAGTVPGHENTGPQNASRREAARSGRSWSPGLLRPGCSSVTERCPRAFPASTARAWRAGPPRRGSL